MSTIERAAPITSTISVGRIIRLWEILRTKGIAFLLVALAVFCCAAIPLYISMERTQAEFRIGSLQRQILYEQQQKARLTQELSDRLSIGALEQAGKQLGLQPPVSIDYAQAP